MASTDSTLLAIASKAPVTSYAELASRLRALDAELDASDGLVWFNRWYVALTAALVESTRRHRFDDARFVERLECHAAEHYFGALRAHLTDPGSGPSSWEPLFQARSRSDVLPIQYAIAGINAHVNHDLPLALVATCVDLQQVPARQAPAHADYQRLAALLDGVLCNGVLGSGVLGERAASDRTPSDRAPSSRTPSSRTPSSRRNERWLSTGAGDGRSQLEEALSIWSSKRACEGAWASAEVRWALGVSPLISHHHLEALDRIVGLAGRSLLHPWPPPSPVQDGPSASPSR